MGTTQTFTRAGAFEQICMHRNANLNLLCTRQNHHAGDHAAVDLDGTVRASWATEKDLATQLAQTYVDALNRSGLVPHDWDHLPNVPRYEVHHGMQFVEAHLQSTGRLLGDDEMRLTAELAENLRMVLDNFGRHSITSDMTTAAKRLADALFPATEPAGPCSRGVCSANNGHDRTCAEASGWAESAEGETKAEATDDGYVIADAHEALGKAGLNHVQRSDAINQLHNAGLLIRRRTSSPVVPAPTETEWQTWQEVPEGRTVQAANGERFRKTGVDAIHLLTNGVSDCCKISTATDLLPAPFVAAEG